MKSRIILSQALLIVILFGSCGHKEKSPDMKIIFLHHSTGGVIWKGGATSAIAKVAGRISGRFANLISPMAGLPLLFERYNSERNKSYLIKEMTFPKASPYGWNNYPYDYYNIWVKNEGGKPFMGEPTLEMLTRDYQVIIFKHCFPTSKIQADLDSSDINSEIKTISNYKLQYLALREKLHEFQAIRFILFTGAAQVKSNITEEEARRSQEFFAWVTNEWDIPGDNIFLWDLYGLQTEGGLYFKDDYAVSPNDPHPNNEFAARVVTLLFDRIIDVIDNQGLKTQITGEKK